jgi:nucleoside-diphosphate-sugar epimerase
MPSLVILGANGFLGKSVIEHCRGVLPIKAIVRTRSAGMVSDENVTWFDADLIIPHSLDAILQEDDIVINLTYIPTNSQKNNLILIDNVIDSCIKYSVKRLIHCSTANVVGTVKSAQIDESVTCNPVTEYEKVKFNLEQHILNRTHAGLDVIILRPSAIVGPGGKNLVKLAESLLNGKKLINYLRASLFRNRKMHLVSVNNVSAAILHVANLKNIVSGSVYFVTSDEDVQNNFLSIEKLLCQALGLKQRNIPLLPIPSFVLSLILRIKGSSGSDLFQIYKSDKLGNTNFNPVDSLQNAVVQFSKHYIDENGKVTG